jgi:hypothetical protein
MINNVIWEWDAKIKTASGDLYALHFHSEPSKFEIVKSIWEFEGRIKNLEWYEQTLSVSIKRCEN